MIALRDRLRQFCAERDWDRFHSPKNLASALSVEAAELLEHFQWLTEAESNQLSPDKRAQVAGVILQVAYRLNSCTVQIFLRHLSDAVQRAHRQRAGCVM